jgi:hypothetical protein
LTECGAEFGVSGKEAFIGESVDWLSEISKAGYLNQEAVDYYSREMGEVLGKLAPISTEINRAGEMAAHAAMAADSVLPALSDDAAVAATAVVSSGEAFISGTRAIRMGADKISSAAVAGAGRSSTASKIISGMKTAMKVTGVVK